MSFETPGWGVPPPTASSSAPAAGIGGANKRKRPSTYDETKVTSASVNLEKLMAAMEREDRDSKPGKKAQAKQKGKDDRKELRGKVQAAKGNVPGGGDTPGPKKGPPGPAAGGNKKEGGKKNAAASTPSKPAVAAAAPVSSTPSKSPSKKGKPSPAAAAAPPKHVAPTPAPAVDSTASAASANSSERPKKKSKKEKKKAATETASATAAPPSSTMDVDAAESIKAAVPKNAVLIADDDVPVSSLEGLTPMQAKMKGRLEGARFRWINEQLYTTSSSSALGMMRSDPSVFADYHTGFRHQASSWPSSPLHLITSTLRSSLPTGSLVIDLGCGDADLAKTLVPEGYRVLSYDLVPSDYVVEADFCQRIELPRGEARIVDAAVCCLSLMGRNWIQGVREIAAVLKEGGIYEVAEITSRMPSADAFIAMVCSLGFKLTTKDDSNTHFLLMSFVRSGEATWDEDGSVEWEEVLRKGEEVLKACIYKKR